MKIATTFAAAFVAQLATAAGLSPDIATAADLAAAVFDRAETGRTFAITGAVVQTDKPSGKSKICFVDATGGMFASIKDPCLAEKAFRAGDRICVDGVVAFGTNSEREYARCTNAALVASGPAPEPVRTDCAGVLGGSLDMRLVRLRATVREIVQDETDEHFTFIVVGDGTAPGLPVAVRSEKAAELFGDASPVGAVLDLTGFCIVSPLAARRQFGRLVEPLSDGLTLTVPAPLDPFDAPELGEFRRLQPLQIAALGRHRATGDVLAVLDRRKIVLDCGENGVRNAELAPGVAPPACGMRITAVGFPRSDLYRTNLDRALWRAENTHGEQKKDSPLRVTANDILRPAGARTNIDPKFHGKTIRLEGVVIDMRRQDPEASVILDCDGCRVNVDASAAPEAIDDVKLGCRVAISGTCAMNTENWRPDAIFPRIASFSLAVRSCGDVEILVSPPWWTPGRLVAAIVFLAIALLGVFAWNVAISRISERRGRLLYEEQIKRAESELKTYERTRLAIELHDSLSQNLAGVSFEIDAAKRLAPDDASESKKHLETAMKSIDSCRGELRNCLWDLRNSALEEPDMEAAVRRTLAPIMGAEKLSVRFNVPREMLSDTTAHAIIRIVRELAANALRHGGAKRILVAGSIEGAKMLFSVRDDGCGFDPETVPGPGEGHFGLQGVRERIESMGGNVKIASASGRGAHITASIPLDGLQITDAGHRATKSETTNRSPL